jgi:4-alpha-glucanotransferase
MNEAPPPTYPVYGNSPYSSVSSFAGNTLIITPDLLSEEGQQGPLFLEIQDPT